jgi:hypothetical protein
MRELISRYRQLKVAANRDLGHHSIATTIAELALHARGLLASIDHGALASRVAGKQYFNYRGEHQSRPVNQDLFELDDGTFRHQTDRFISGMTSESPDTIVRIAYTLAYSVFVTNDVFGIGRKASATYFEILSGHMVARHFGISPRRKVRIPESGTDLPTDYVFDPGERSRKVHLPVKTSTRERAVQAWVHQLVLDRIFGTGMYRGVLVVASETKRNTRTDEVVEICVPRQLQMFQARVAEISRVYYLDPPAPYLALAETFPRVEVRSFGLAFSELDDLLRR